MTEKQIAMIALLNIPEAFDAQRVSVQKFAGDPKRFTKRAALITRHLCWRDLERDGDFDQKPAQKAGWAYRWRLVGRRG